jgi:hypothetical protein
MRLRAKMENTFLHNPYTVEANYELSREVYNNPYSFQGSKKMTEAAGVLPMLIRPDASPVHNIG